MASDTNAVVLVVDDNRSLADVYTTWLAESYTVKTAYSGEDALDQRTPDVDIVLLDRRMPGLSGEQVLERIRAQNFDCQVAMVTSVEMDYDSLPLKFDDYLQKPATKTDLKTLVESLTIRQEYSEKLQEYFALVSKRVALQTQKDSTDFTTNPEVEALDARIESLRDDIDGLLADLPADEYTALFHVMAADDVDESTHSVG